MKPKLERFIREHPQQQLTPEQKFRIRYGENWRMVAYCEITPMQKYNADEKYLMNNVWDDING